MNLSYVNLKTNFSPLRREKFNLKAGSMLVSETIQFVIEKLKIQIIFYNVTRIVYGIGQILSSRRACNDVATLDLKPHNFLLEDVYST